MTTTAALFDSVVPGASKRTKELLVYFGICLDCDHPILEALFFTSWAEVKMVTNIEFQTALLAHYRTKYKMADMFFYTGPLAAIQLFQTSISDGSKVFIGFGFNGPSFRVNHYNLTLQAGNDSRLWVGFVDDQLSRPLLWRDHFLEAHIAAALAPH